MPWFTFFKGLLIVSVLAVIIRYFWMQLYFIWQIIQIAAMGLFVALLCTIVWNWIYTEDTPDSGRTFLFFYIAYLISALVLFLITLDIFRLGIDFIRSVFKIK